MCDTKGVIHTDRKENINQWKSAHAIKTKKRSLKDALKGAAGTTGNSNIAIGTDAADALLAGACNVAL